MKSFAHKTFSRESDCLLNLIDIHGLDGYGFFWVVIEELYRAENNGFQIEATDTWIKRLARSLNIIDPKNCIQYLNTLSELGLIDDQLWSDRIVCSQEVLSDVATNRKSSGWEATRLTVFNRDGYTCVYCGKKERVMHCDHIHPKSRGGSDSLENLATSCEACNLSKGAKLLSEWRKKSE